MHTTTTTTYSTGMSAITPLDDETTVILSTSRAAAYVGVVTFTGSDGASHRRAGAATDLDGVPASALVMGF